MYWCHFLWPYPSKGEFPVGFFFFAAAAEEYELTTPWQWNMEKENEHKCSWIFLLVMALLNFMTALRLILSISMTQATSPHLSNYSSAASHCWEHVFLFVSKYYSAQWMLKAFLEQQTKIEEENSPLGLSVLLCCHFSRNQCMTISFAKKKSW